MSVPSLVKSSFFKAVQSLEAGTGSPVDTLSDRELEVLQLLGKGHSTGSIADTLHLSVKTIETHRAHIKEKLRFYDSEDMVRFAIDWVAQQE
jgi:DNA-binding NarL/FixJ family response regulator